MKIKLLEGSPICPGCNPWTTGIASDDHRRDSGEMACYLGTDAPKRTDEQVRLQRSWAAVLTELGPREVGASRW
jgi:hypothetical protein